MRKKYEIRRPDGLYTIEPNLFPGAPRAEAWHATRSGQEASILKGRDAADVLKRLQDNGMAAARGLPLRLYEWNEVSWP